MPKKRVAYYHDPDVGAYSYGLVHPMKPHRMRMTHNLVMAYGMLEKMDVLRPKRATPQQMTMFHTDEYIHFLHRVTPETAEELTRNGKRFLVGEDNPAFEGLFEFCSISAGGSIAASQRINDGMADIAINWAGGLHHAKKREASGFCYINDIVLGILDLLRTFPRVLYIDIDCHHGDGVEEAFYTTDRVLTCSFHKFGEYFPGTGHLMDRGRGKGKAYSVNVPLKDGITDAAFKGVFEPVIDHILEWYRPSAVVLQCGTDSLAGDKLGCFNLTMQGHASCVTHLRASGLPLILLGGGGYTVKNVARTWTYETACAIGIEEEIDKNLPWHDYFEWFGPRYRLEVVEDNMDDWNMKDGYLDRIKTEVLRHLRDLPFAPSVHLQSTPRESVGSNTGIRPDGSGEGTRPDGGLSSSSSLLPAAVEQDEDEEDEDAEQWQRARERGRRRTIMGGWEYDPDPDEALSDLDVRITQHVLNAHITRSETESDGGSDWDSEDGEYRGPPSYGARGWSGNGNGRSKSSGRNGRKADERGYHSYPNGTGHAYDSRPRSSGDAHESSRNRTNDAYGSTPRTRGDRDVFDREGYEPQTEGPPPAKQRRRFFRSEMVWNGVELQMKLRSNPNEATGASGGAVEEGGSEESAGGGGSGDKDKDIVVEVDEEGEVSGGSVA